VESWCNALRWFFRNAERQDATSVPSPEWVCNNPDAPDWQKRMLRVLRIRKYAYETEKSYIYCAQGFLRFIGSQNPNSLSDDDIRRYLDHLAYHSRSQALPVLILTLLEFTVTALGGSNDVVHVSIVQLLSNPQKHGGKKVLVSGVLHVEFGDSSRFLSTEHW